MRFHRGEIAVQERAGVRDIAADVGEGIADHLPPGASEFLERRQMCVLGTADSRGSVWASVVTGDPGFIETVDARTLRIATNIKSSDPLVRNLATEGHTALFAPDFVSSRRVRVNGRGVIRNGAIYITTDEVYGNCRRYLQERIFIGTRETQAAGKKGALPPRCRHRSKSRFRARIHSSSRPTIPSAAPTSRIKAATPALCECSTKNASRSPTTTATACSTRSATSRSIRARASCSSISTAAHPPAHRSCIDRLGSRTRAHLPRRRTGYRLRARANHRHARGLSAGREIPAILAQQSEALKRTAGGIASPPAIFDQLSGISEYTADETRSAVGLSIELTSAISFCQSLSVSSFVLSSPCAFQFGVSIT